MEVNQPLETQCVNYIQLKEKAGYPVSTAAQEAILHAAADGSSSLSKDYCMHYNPKWTRLPSSLENATSLSLMNLTGTPLCHPSDIPPDGIKNKAVVVQWGSCHILEKAQIAQKGGAEALLIANSSILTLGDNVTVQMYSPSWPNFDYTMVVIFAIAVFTVALGGYWSGVIELENMKAVTDAEDKETRRKKEEYLTFSPLTVVLFVVICCVMIVLLYFFYRWLGLLLVYDVFFVFITPFITKNGESIMVELAAGPFENAEKLPVLIRVPKLICYSVMSVCFMPVSILGFGDIIVPAYAVGMIITFVVLVLMKKGQPALLYLVPCTLITASVIAWSRKEMKKFWKGSNYQVMEHLDYSTNEESPGTTGEQAVQQ
ncbi:Signal peptide peptidase-like 2A [Microtus ochrogaster]|uniref:Signal peptide peptidase-like 2A n=1 Tax=Microtus ochrogaster TaxID=79684 RepID=A0A8J6KLX8_MICOH|nr:Signal peptide peptidase-like 2A [Microtus ochrogaster]